MLVGLLVLGAILGGACGAGHCGSNTPGEDENPTHASPPSPEKCRSFNSTDELYQVVDIYVLRLTEDPQESIVAQTYGYPIGTWDVSQIKDFS
jgi:hypothetical protein